MDAEQAKAAANFAAALPHLRGYQTDPSFSTWQLDPKDVLELIEHTLRGEVWKSSEDGRGGGWTKSDGIRPMLNEAGIQAILQKVTKVVNRVVIMSNLDEMSINNWLWDLGHDLAGELVVRIWPDNDWEIDEKDLDSIHDLIILLTEVALKRALHDGERRKLYETQKSTETHVVEKGKEGGLFSIIPGLGGGAR